MLNIKDLHEIEFDALGGAFPDGDDPITNRSKSMYSQRLDECEVTIVVTFHNHPLGRVKKCVSAILENTKDVPFKLLFINSTEDSRVLDYLLSVPVEDKLVINAPNTIPVGQKWALIPSYVRTPFFSTINSDAIVTPNWLSNMLRCIKSDPSIGRVCPMATNISNLQQVPFRIENDGDIARYAKSFNKSDPKKWYQRLRLIDVVALTRSELLNCAGAFDIAIAHNFSEDDYSLRIRRAGYKLMLCGDVFIHHDHDYSHMTQADSIKFQSSLNVGRALYQNRYYGLDAWDDVNNFELVLISLLDAARLQGHTPSILGIDCKMGTPILEAKNKLREGGITENDACAFTTEAKYYTDLQTVCGKQVVCDREAFFGEHYADGSFDIIVLGRPINEYERPYEMLRQLARILRPSGSLLLKLHNTQDISRMMRMLGSAESKDDSPNCAALTLDDFATKAVMHGLKDIKVAIETQTVDSETKNSVFSLLLSLGSTPAKAKELFTQLSVSNYCVCATK